MNMKTKSLPPPPPAERVLTARQASGIRLDDPKLIPVALHRVARMVLTGKLSPQVANCFAYLSSMAIRAHDTADLAVRLDELEEALTGRGATANEDDDAER
ncbi:MAG: hypothetical protein KC635_24185 [Myxococcales bacterium]|nr:hypothetical protein [Myxococcales bacterium]